MGVCSTYVRGNNLRSHALRLGSAYVHSLANRRAGHGARLGLELGVWGLGRLGGVWVTCVHSTGEHTGDRRWCF